MTATSSTTSPVSWTRREVFNRHLAVKVPYHTHYMELVKDELYGAFDGLSSSQATIPLYSTVTGERLDGYAAGAAYWWQNTRATVLFEPALRRMLDDGYTHFVELGPHPVLAASIFETAGTEKALVLATQRRNDDDGRTLLNCVGALHCNGHDIAWDAVHPRGTARLLKLPSYPWQTKRYWNESPESTEDLHYDPVHPLLGQPVGGVHPTWEAELSTAHLPFLADHRVQGSVVVPGAVYVEMALAAAKETYGSDHRRRQPRSYTVRSSSTRPAIPSCGPPSTRTTAPWSSPRSPRPPTVTSSGRHGDRGAHHAAQVAGPRARRPAPTPPTR